MLFILLGCLCVCLRVVLLHMCLMIDHYFVKLARK